MADHGFILASASPRRLQLLRRIGIDPEVVPSGLDEDAGNGERPDLTVVRLAESKGRQVASRLNTAGSAALILSADTAVVLGNRVLGKPADDADAASMLRLLAGQLHRVMTGVFVLRTDDGRSAATVEITEVRFKPLDERLIDWYVSTGEPRDKAGAYGIQGCGVLLTESISGSWSNVVGLPLERLPGLFGEIGIDLLEAGQPISSS